MWAYLDLAAQLCLHLSAVLSCAWPLCFLADLARLPCSSLVQGPAHSFTPLLSLGQPLLIHGLRGLGRRRSHEFCWASCAEAAL